MGADPDCFTVRLVTVFVTCRVDEKGLSFIISNSLMLVIIYLEGYGQSVNVVGSSNGKQIAQMIH